MLEIARVGERFGTRQAWEDVSFTVGPGEVFGFVGRNGAGKTTTMRIVLGVLSADAGEVSWKGRPVDAELRRRIGYMPEERGLYPTMRVGLATVLSFIPFFSRTVMPARYALGVASLREVLVAAAPAVAAIVVVVRVAGRVHRNSVLRTGARVSLREALTG